MTAIVWIRRSLRTYDNKALVEACCTAENDMMTAEYNARNGAALDQLITEHGVSLHKFPVEVWNEIAGIADEVVRDAHDDDIGKRIVDSYFAFRENVRGYSAISEQAYMNARGEGTYAHTRSSSDIVRGCRRPNLVLPPAQQCRIRTSR